MTDISTIVGVLILAYLLGSIPFGLLFSRIGGLGDIRKTGSGNTGATNVLRSGNKLLAALTLLADAAKGSAASNLLPERKTFVAPILPEPVSRISPKPPMRLNKRPKGMEPRR